MKCPLKRPRWPAWVLVTTLLFVGSAFFLAGRWLDSKPLILPIDLKPGVTRSSKFRLSQEARYLVSLEVERHVLPDDLQGCLLGEARSRPPCTVDSVIDLRWTLWSGSREVASGSSRSDKGLGRHGSVTTMYMGEVEGSPRAAYVLEVASMRDGSVLAAANPRIVVALDPVVSKGQFVAALLGSLFLAPVVGLGILWLILWAVLALAKGDS